MTSGKLRSPRPRFVDDLENINVAAVFLKRFGNNVAFGIDREISPAPTIDIVRPNRGINVPLVLHFSGAPKSEAMRIINHARQTFKTALKNFRPGDYRADFGSLVFPLRADNVRRDEQDGDRGAGARSVADQRRLRGFYRQQRQGLYHLCRSNRRQRHHNVHARHHQGAAAHRTI